MEREVRIIFSSEFNGFLRLHIPIVVDNLTGISFRPQTLLGKLGLILKGIEGEMAQQGLQQSQFQSDTGRTAITKRAQIQTEVLLCINQLLTVLDVPCALIFYVLPYLAV